MIACPLQLPRTLNAALVPPLCRKIHLLLILLTE